MSIRLILFLLLVNMPAIVTAAELYETEVEVADQSTEVRLGVIPVAFEQVLIKVSGFSEVAEEPSIKGELENAARYLQQYRYRVEKVPASEGAGEAERLMLWLRFDDKGLNQLLRDANIPIWSTVRPLTLVWLAVETQGRQRVIAADDASVVKEVLEKEAEQRGLPIRLPEMDEVDKRKVNTADVWGNFYEVIVEASARYQPGAVLIGKLYPLSDGSQKVHWSLYHEGQQSRWEKRSSDMQALLASGIDGTSDKLAMSVAESYNYRSGQAIFTIHEIYNFSALQRTLDYLAGVPGVTAVDVKEVKGGTVRLKVDTRGGLDYVLKGIAVGNILGREEGATDSELEFRLLP